MDNSEIVSKLGILNKPGDRLEARITDSNRRVVKVQTDNGNSKYSATQYPNGTLVETKVTKQKNSPTICRYFSLSNHRTAP